MSRSRSRSRSKSKSRSSTRSPLPERQIRNKRNSYRDDPYMRDMDYQIGKLKSGLNRPLWDKLLFNSSYLGIVCKTGIMTGIISLTGLVVKEVSSGTHSKSSLEHTFDRRLGHEVLGSNREAAPPSDDERVLRRSTTFPLDSYYMLDDDNVAIEKADFPLKYLLSNTSVDSVAWTYFFLDVPHCAAGATLHI